jgi:hypothetical protein
VSGKTFNHAEPIDDVQQQQTYNYKVEFAENWDEFVNFKF